ncbi:AMP-binding protein [Kribbella sp. NBC_01505]|uniref:AMP-binding protein n=1 Tax=Kribbella sp. NBC_01505 TaxID=2903580 RepID=UPI0038647375
MPERTLDQWFAAAVGRHGNQPALEVCGRSLSYQQLSGLAAVVARRILAVHGGPPERLALLAARSLVAYTGYLAALRIGAAVVPVNPSSPVHRNAEISRLAQVDFLLSDANGARQLSEWPADLDRTVLCLADEDLVAASSSKYDAAGSAGRPVTADAVAYIVFTSGSTGRPKGVPIRHRQVAPYISRSIDRYRVSPGCRMSHTFELTFDPSIFDLFVTWGGGATLVVPERAGMLAPVAYIEEEELTHWYSVPSVISIGAELGNLPTGRVSSLRYSTFVGEPLTFRQAALWQEVAPGTIIDNVYGPTELTVTCADYRLPGDRRRWPVTSNATVPIGAVYDHLEHLVVDEDGRPSDEGELCLRGLQRFDGYLDPADNRGRFVSADATWGITGYLETAPASEHYYRTGDRVRLESGTLVHLGRLDNQVKIRGHRIEPGDVESAIREHPQVADAIVVAVPRAEGGLELVGYFTGDPMGSGELRRWLRRRIPVHMVPRRIRHLETIPRNPNGKADRRALTADAGYV